MKKITTIGLLTITILSGCMGKGDVETTTEKINRFNVKEAEVFDLAKDEIAIPLSATGFVDSSSQTLVMPEVPGRITGVKIQVGDQVKRGQSLITLGDSLSTDSNNVQRNGAIQGVELNDQSKFLNHQGLINSLNSADLQVAQAENAYYNSLISRDNAEEGYEQQLDISEIQLENAEDAYDQTKKYYKSLRDSEAATEAEIKQAKNAMEQAESALEMAEEGINQLEITFESQLDQIDFGIENAYLGYLAALNGRTSGITANDSQRVGIEQQGVQASTNLELLSLSKKKQNITAPIDGYISDVSANLGNLANPGQVLVTIESGEEKIVKMKVTTEEAAMLRMVKEIKVSRDEETFSAKLKNINPTVDKTSQKVEVELTLEDDETLLPGEMVKVEFIPQFKKKIFVPLNSIFLEDGKKLVKLVVNGQVKLQEVTTGKVLGDFIEVKKGLKGTEKIIKNSANFLEEGDKVINTNDGK